MKQYKFFVDLSQEESYLKQMSEQGWRLNKRSITGRYVFEKQEPKPLSYKIDYRVFNKKKDFLSYISLFEDAGFEHVWGNAYSGHQYFLPKTPDASSEIFSDRESKAQRYKRLQQNCVYLVIMMIAYLMINVISVDFVISDLFFLTPGLWEKQGAEFWRAFWFEFPFMLMRVLPVVFFVAAAVLNAMWAAKAKKLYHTAIAQEEVESL